LFIFYCTNTTVKLTSALPLFLIIVSQANDIIYNDNLAPSKDMSDASSCVPTDEDNNDKSNTKHSTAAIYIDILSPSSEAIPTGGEDNDKSNTINTKHSTAAIYNDILSPSSEAIPTGEDNTTNTKLSTTELTKCLFVSPTLLSKSIITESLLSPVSPTLSSIENESSLPHFPPPLNGKDEIIFISNPEDVSHAIACVRARASGAIAVDLEGVNLSRDGLVCIVQIAVARRGAPIFLFDISALGDAAFEGKESLRGLLEDAELEKLFFDCRADLNALLFLHKVATCNVVDLQLADVAHRLVKGIHCDRVAGLGYLVERTHHAQLEPKEAVALAACKTAARGLFVPELGGTYEVWQERPLPSVLIEYCTDAALFFSLRVSFDKTLKLHGSEAMAALTAAAQRRVVYAHSDDFIKSDRAVLTAVDPELINALKNALGGRLPSIRDRQNRGRGGGFGGGGWATRK
jgi:exonuclease 3'-5' domain-containing protein 1